MRLKRFSEYVNEKGKIEKPKVKVVADYDGPMATKPDGKNQTPYKAGESEDAPKGEKGLGDLASPGITPATSSLGEKPNSKKTKKYFKS